MSSIKEKGNPPMMRTPLWLVIQENKEGHPVGWGLSADRDAAHQEAEHQYAHSRNVDDVRGALVIKRLPGKPVSQSIKTSLGFATVGRIRAAVDLRRKGTGGARVTERVRPGDGWRRSN